MARYSKKSQYTEFQDRVIYILHSSCGKEFYISHCRKDLLKDVYRDHLRGERYATEAYVKSCKEQDIRICLHILEEVTCTKVQAYQYVIAWTKIFCDNGLIPLNQGNVVCYIEDMYDNTLSIYNQRQNTTLEGLLPCRHCVVKTYGRKLCPNYKEENYE